jgi:hypothetical protein
MENTVFARAQAAFFWQEFTVQNWGAAYTRIPKSSEKKPLSF